MADLNLPAANGLTASQLYDDENGLRLELDFGVNSSENVDTERRDQILKSKGAEWVELFGEDANDDDDFKFGLALCSLIVLQQLKVYCTEFRRLH